MNDTNYYPDVDQQPEQAEGNDDEQQQPDGETALVPKSLFGDGDVQPGQEITLKVVALHEDEVEVARGGKTEEGQPGDEEGSEMDRATGKLNALAQ